MRYIDDSLIVAGVTLITVLAAAWVVVQMTVNSIDVLLLRI